MARRHTQRVLISCSLVACPALGQSTALSEPDTTQVRVVSPVAEPERLVRPLRRRHRIVSVRYPQAQEGVDRFRASIPELVDFANEETQLEDIVFVGEELRLADPQIGTPLMLFLTGNLAPLPFTSEEKIWLGTYLRGGGLLYAEDVRARSILGSDVAQSGTPFDVGVKALLADSRVLGEQAQLWQRITHEHPIYHTFFEFLAGPPLSNTSGRTRGANRVTELEILQLRGRTVAIFSDLNISYGWASLNASGRRRALQFGTNLLIFALAEHRAGPTR